MFQKKIEKALKEHLTGKIALEVPPSPEMGDFAFPCFPLAKEMKKSPADIAKDLAKQITIEQVEVKATGPYVNFFIQKAVLFDTIINPILEQKEHYGKKKQGKETFMVEFFHANTHKGVHIGHMRTLCLGNALSNILEAAGKKVIRANYQGDIGPHVAKCLWGLKHFKDKPPKKDRSLFLGEVYMKANQEMKDDPKIEKEIKDLTTKLYAADKSVYKEWMETRQWCLDEFDEFYKDFGVTFDRFYFESEVEKPAVDISKELVKKGIAKEDDDAIIIDFEDEVLGIFVLVTKEGYALYSSKDLALAKLKLKEYPKIDKSIHVVGKEQELHFKQVFKSFELMGINLPSHHLIYELVMLPEGKMSSREGTVVLWPELRDRLFEKSLEEVQKRHEDWSKKDIEASAKNIAYGALKFGMLSRGNQRQIIFDWEKALDFEGETAAYIQYAHARLCSVLRKAPAIKKADLSLLKTKEENALMKILASYPDVVEKAAKEYKVHLLAHYLIDLARHANECYHAHPILKAEDNIKAARLTLVKATKQVLANGLSLLGITAPERM